MILMIITIISIFAKPVEISRDFAFGKGYLHSWRGWLQA